MTGSDEQPRNLVLGISTDGQKILMIPEDMHQAVASAISSTSKSRRTEHMLRKIRDHLTAGGTAWIVDLKAREQADEARYGRGQDKNAVARADRIHEWFGLSYANYLVLPRTLLQSMPPEWQARFVVMLEQFDQAFAHIPHAEAYKVDAAEEEVVCEMTEAQLEVAGITVEDGPCLEDHDHAVNEGADCWPEEVFTDATGWKMAPYERVLLPVRDPVPHYNRGRARIEPHLTETTDDSI